MKKKMRNVRSYPVDLFNGRVLAPGESAIVDDSEAHNADLIEAGVLLPVVEPIKNGGQK